jgi:hypothetical protein
MVMRQRFAAHLLMSAAIVAGGYPHSAQAGAAVSQTDMASSNPGNAVTFPLAGSDMQQRAHDLTARQRAEAKQDSEKLIKAMSLSCQTADAERIGHGTAMVGGKRVEINAYEVACSNGMGYLLASMGPSKPMAISCFSADATHAESVARGEKSELYCQLAGNKDVKAVAASLMSTAGTACAVDKLRWFGLVASTQTEYTEVACGDGRGYLLKAVQIEPAAQVSVVSCQDAAKQGLKCHLTDGGPVTVPVTEETFRDALKANGVACEPSKLRLIGRETVSRRYVVELQCPGQPGGLVAFIPLGENIKAFETLDCAAAMERHVVCTLEQR